MYISNQSISKNYLICTYMYRIIFNALHQWNINYNILHNNKL